MMWFVGVYWALASAAILGGFLLGVQTWEHRRFARSRCVNPHVPAALGHLALFVPCKGHDADLESNLRPLFEQDYDDYEIVFVVESWEDDACGVIARLIASYRGRRARLLTAGACSDCGQKVHNLRAATEQLGPDTKILAFADADVRPPRDWLRLLTQNLDKRGAASGYRWVVPRRNTWANCLLSSMDSAVVPLMFPGLHHVVWGGSWAIRRDVFEATQLREAWRGTLSDDLVAARVLAEHDVEVAVEPACVLASPADFNAKTMFAFARRQFMIGRCYLPTLWSIALAWNCVYAAALWISLLAFAWGFATTAPWSATPGQVAALLYLLHVYRAWVRQDATRWFLPSYQEALTATRRFDIWLGPLASLCFCLGLVGSAVGRQIVWKNIRYEMRSGGRVGTVVRPTEKSCVLPRATEKNTCRCAA